MGSHCCSKLHIARYIAAQARDVFEWQTCFSSQLPSTDALSNVVCRYLEACKALESYKLLTVLVLMSPSQICRRNILPLP